MASILNLGGGTNRSSHESSDTVMDVMDLHEVDLEAGPHSMKPSSLDLKSNALNESSNGTLSTPLVGGRTSEELKKDTGS